MENFIYPYQQSDRAKITNEDGASIVVGRRIVQQIALKTAVILEPEDLAFVLRRVADRVWDQANMPSEKILASKMHALAAQLAEIGVELGVR